MELSKTHYLKPLLNVRVMQLGEPSRSVTRTVMDMSASGKSKNVPTSQSVSLERWHLCGVDMPENLDMSAGMHSDISTTE